jgi:hypothetical protein
VRAFGAGVVGEHVGWRPRRTRVEMDALTPIDGQSVSAVADGQGSETEEQERMLGTQRDDADIVFLPRSNMRRQGTRRSEVP